MDITELRRRYAHEICRLATVTSPALIDAFARVPREHFVGAGPWQIAQPFDSANPYRTTADNNLEHIYHDVLVAIDAARLLNNGQPSGHARWIDAVLPQPGESVLHIGCGVGYYSAIFAELVGGTGRVVACEIDPELGRRAQQLLAAWPQARAELGDGSDAFGRHDVIYVNAGATHPRPEWLAALAPGGRMLLPLTVHVPGHPHGVGFVVRLARGEREWPARFVSPVGIFDCAGARADAAEAQLRALLARGAAMNVRALSLEPHERGAGCLLHGDGACLRE
jgi:protein-L-isoaspartate(D-aspartate) O-methyltransferase